MDSTDRLARLTAQQRVAMQIAADKHGGVVPVPYLGTSWQERGAGYRARRVLASLTLLLCAVLCLGLAFGVTLGLLHGVGPVVAAVYWLTALPGVILGVRLARRGPGAVPRAAYGGGCAAVLISPFAGGICLGYLAMTFGRLFPGEADAQAATEHWQELDRLSRAHPRRRGS